MSDAFPAPDMSSWPGTRIGALVFDAVVLLLLFLYRMRLHSLRANLNEIRCSPAGSSLASGIRWSFGFVPSGVDVLTCSAEGSGIELSQSDSCCTAPCNDRVVQVPGSAGVDVAAAKGRRCGVLTVLKAFVLGCGCGLFLHFIPCLWWTCDWGDHDGQGVRGAIWFAVWPISMAVMLWMHTRSGDYIRITDGSSRWYCAVGGEPSAVDSAVQHTRQRLGVRLVESGRM